MSRDAEVFDYQWEEDAARKERVVRIVKIVLGFVLLLLLTCASRA